MIYWSIVSEEEQTYSTIADSIQLTLFAVSKSEGRSRLISCPRVQNSALPDPPYTLLPDPSMFEAIEVNGCSQSSFYLDIENMFHNITLPLCLTKLFPMKPLKFSQLEPETTQRIQKRFPHLTERDDPLVRPCQAKMPMGFKWAVFIAHSFVGSCLPQAYQLFCSSRMGLPDLRECQALRADQLPILISRSSPLLLHIIDNVTAVVVDWPPEAVKACHAMTRNVLRANMLPVSEKKSCKPQNIDSSLIGFIGCQWNLRTMTFAPAVDKIIKTITQAQHLLQSYAVTPADWERIIGRLVWMAAINRPLFSCMQRVFLMTHCGDRWVPQHIPEACKKELRMLVGTQPRQRIALAVLLLACGNLYRNKRSAPAF